MFQEPQLDPGRQRIGQCLPPVHVNSRRIVQQVVPQRLAARSPDEQRGIDLSDLRRLLVHDRRIEQHAVLRGPRTQTLAVQEQARLVVELLDARVDAVDQFAEGLRGQVQLVQREHRRQQPVLHRDRRAVPVGEVLQSLDRHGVRITRPRRRHGQDARFRPRIQTVQLGERELDALGDARRRLHADKDSDGLLHFGAACRHQFRSSDPPVHEPPALPAQGVIGHQGAGTTRDVRVVRGVGERSIGGRSGLGQARQHAAERCLPAQGHAADDGSRRRRSPQRR